MNPTNIRSKYKQDMVECDEPDRFSIVTYVSQFYHLLKVN